MNGTYIMPASRSCIHFALVRIRGFTFPAIPNETDRREEINDLADLLHNLPR